VGAYGQISSAQFRFLFLDEEHFVNQTFKFPMKILMGGQLFAKTFVSLIVHVTQSFPTYVHLCLLCVMQVSN